MRAYRGVPSASTCRGRFIYRTHTNYYSTKRVFGKETIIDMRGEKDAEVANMY